MRVAQLEKVIDLPPELDAFWDQMQAQFGLVSDGGNLMSNIVLNHDLEGRMVLKANTGLSEIITRSEEDFSSIFFQCELQVRDKKPRLSTISPRLPSSYFRT